MLLERRIVFLLNKGRAFGVYGQAGFTTSGYNYAVYGNLTSTQNGAAVVGALDNLDVKVPGRYAGYFQGDVRYYREFLWYGADPFGFPVCLMGRSAVMPLSAEVTGEQHVGGRETFAVDRRAV